MSDDRTEVAVVEGLRPAPVLIVCEHASNAFPAPWGDLGLTDAQRRAHIAWDPGALDLSRDLSRRLGAPLIHAAQSRLIFDLNRPPDAPDAMPEVSEVHEIPGNRGLSNADRAARVAGVHDPWHARLAETVRAVGPAAMVTVHTFTPVYKGVRRDTKVGILHDSDSRLADAMLDGAPKGWRRNDPYGPEDGVTHTLAAVAQPRGIAPVMIEVRNDLLPDADSVARMGETLAASIRRALAATGIAAEGAGA